MDEIDEMFSNLLGEMDLLTQSLEIETLPPPTRSTSTTEINFSVGFKDLNESLNALEDNDLDALMAELVADITDAEQNVATYNNKSTAPFPPADASNSYHFHPPPMPSIITEDLSLLPPPPEFDPHYPPPPPDPLTEPKTQEELESKAKANKINLALSKMKEAKVKKRIVKVHMIDSSTKTLMVEEHQTVRDVLDNLFEKTHCDCSIEWCLFEVTPELQIERFFEDHENIVEILANWTRDSVNTIHFLEKNEKYAVFKNPQNFYMATKGSADLKDMNEKNKVSLLEQSFCGASVTVPELEAALYLKEDGKKSWKKRYFLLRASGIYYVPKGKTKTSRDLACFVQFDNVNVYYGTQYRMKYKAPTDHCFVLKHPQIQKESQYIKYLCCEDPWLLHQWVTGIRIAKYGKILYDNYKTAVQRGGLASHWSTLGSSSVSTAAGSSQGNGQICQNVTTISSSFSDAWKHGEANKQEKKSSEVNKPETKSATPTVTKRPPPTPRRASSISRVTDHPAFPPKPKAINTDIMSGPPQFPPPEPLQPADDFLPPPPPDFFDAPPDFLPPSPPSFMSNAENPPPPPVTQLQMSNAPAPPPPPPPPAPAANVPPLPVKKHPPKPPKRQSIVGPMPGTNAHGGAGGQPDFMSDLMKALQKKREPPT